MASNVTTNVAPGCCSPVLSGYLLKRMGPSDEDGLVACGLQLVHAQKPCEALLREVMSMYSCLGTLARMRGIVDPIKCVLPWHVAAVMKAQAVLKSTLRWADG